MHGTYQLLRSRMTAMHSCIRVYKVYLSICLIKECNKIPCIDLEEVEICNDDIIERVKNSVRKNSPMFVYYIDLKNQLS